MTKQEMENYRKFMADPHNEGNCQHCPNNEGFEFFGNSKKIKEGE